MKRTIRCPPIAISLFLLAAGQAQPGDMLQDASQAFNRGNYARAIQLLKEARVGSANCEIPFYLGLSRYRLHQVDDAIVDLASAAACNPQSIEFLSGLAEAYSAKGDDNRALSAFESVLQLDPSNIPALRSASVLYLRHDMSDKAQSALERLVALDKTDADAKAGLASAYAAHGQFTEAEQIFKQALLLEPQNVSALVGLGNLDLKTDRGQQSVGLLTRAIQLDRHAYEPLVLRGRAYSRLKEYSQAVADFQSAIKLGARDPDLQYFLAQTYRSMGREEDCRRALVEFKRQRDAENRHIESQRDAARMMVEAHQMVTAGDVSGAVALLEKARTLDRANPAILFRLSGLYFENHEYSKAQSSIQDAVKLAPAQWDFYFLEGLIDRGVGLLGPARESLQTAVQLNPSAAEAHNQLGELAMQRTDFATAVKEFSLAAQLKPQEVTYQQNLARASR